MELSLGSVVILRCITDGRYLIVIVMLILTNLVLIGAWIHGSTTTITEG